MRSVVNFFFAAGEKDGHERHNAAQVQPKANFSLRCAPLRMTCHPDPALGEKDLLFFAPRQEVTR
jgi:hypothetical protein